MVNGKIWLVEEREIVLKIILFKKKFRLNNYFV